MSRFYSRTAVDRVGHSWRPLQSSPVSTRRLIILSLLCGVAILVAFVVQLALVI